MFILKFFYMSCTQQNFPRELIKATLMKEHQGTSTGVIPTEFQEYMTEWFPHFVVNIVS